MQTELHFFAPAKINLFLHILGRNPNGYHELQTLFQRISWGDDLYFTRLDTSEIKFNSNFPETPENNLVYRAAKLLQTHFNVKHGVAIRLEKHLPAGAGLGGGSSDAGTTLRALNQLWQLQLPLSTLMDLALQLGADVPLFVLDQNAWAEGIGEKLTPMRLAEQWFVILYPRVHASSKALYGHPDLPRHTPRIDPGNYRFEATHNDFENLVCRLHPEVEKARAWLQQFGPARLTGSGSCLFLPIASEAEGLRIKQKTPKNWEITVCQALI